jgi:GABA(A) receptor-associated protein
LETKRLLVPSDITVAQLTYLLRRRMGMFPEEALFIFAGSVVLSSNTLLSVVYEKHKDLDGFLYIRYSGENTFGIRSSATA